MSRLRQTARLVITAAVAIAAVFADASWAADPPGATAAAEMARKLQDPLANIAAVMTDNDILFKTGSDETSYSFQLQPIKAWSFDEKGFNFVARGIIPILGMAPESQRPIVGEPLPSGDSLTWGLGDMITQFFFSPRTSDAWKWGLGPVLSWKTATDPSLVGPGWGAGPVGVLVGGAGPWSFAFVGGNLWGTESGFNTAFFQPMVFYNFPSAPGLALAYNPMITYDWTASSDNALTLPLGASLSKTNALSGGYGLEFILGGYWNAVKPDGAAEGTIKWAVNVVFP